MLGSSGSAAFTVTGCKSSLERSGKYEIIDGATGINGGGFSQCFKLRVRWVNLPKFSDHVPHGCAISASGLCICLEIICFSLDRLSGSCLRFWGARSANADDHPTKPQYPKRRGDDGDGDLNFPANRNLFQDRRFWGPLLFRNPLPSAVGQGHVRAYQLTCYQSSLK